MYRDPGTDSRVIESVVETVRLWSQRLWQEGQKEQRSQERKEQILVRTWMDVDTVMSIHAR